MSNIDEFYITNDIYGELNNAVPQTAQSYGNLGYEVDETSHKLEEPSKIYYLRCFTIIFDILLMGCGLCLFLGRWVFFTVVLDVHFELGRSIIIFGSIYVLLGPFGMLGASKHKALLLTVHNVGMLLILCANAFIAYIIYSNGLFLKIELILSNVTCNVEFSENFLLCCCTVPVPTGTKCWQNSTLSHQDEQVHCKLHLDKQIETIQETGFYFLPISMNIQALAMISGYLVVMCKNRYNRKLLKQVLRQGILNDSK